MLAVPGETVRYLDLYCMLQRQYLEMKMKDANLFQDRKLSSLPLYIVLTCCRRGPVSASPSTPKNSELKFELKSLKLMNHFNDYPLFYVNNNIVDVPRETTFKDLTQAINGSVIVIHKTF